MIKEQIENKIYFKSAQNNIEIKNENIAKTILNCIKSKPNKVMLLDELSNRVHSHDIANHIERVTAGLNILKINPKDIVGVLLPNVIEIVPIILGSLLNGAIVSLTNPDNTENELKNSIATVDPKCIIIDNINYDRLKPIFKNLFPSCEVLIVINNKFGVKITGLDTQLNYTYNESIKIIDYIDLINNDGKYNLHYSKVNINDTAFILFSSGTTGKFKGVCLPYRYLQSGVYQTITATNIKETDIVINIAPLYHAFGIAIVCFPLIMIGGSLIISRKFNLKHFFSSIEYERPNRIVLVPSIALLISKSKLLDTINCSSIKNIWCAGAPLSSEICKVLQKRIGLNNNDFEINNLYGLTESCPISSSKNNDKGSVGYLAPNIIGKIVDAAGNSLNSNQVGEICIKGPNTMVGYYKNESATKESFDDEGFLFTGDIGYFDDDGELFLIDRKKELIKSYGNQVSPSELESILLTHPKISDVCVIGVPSEESGECPRAYIVLKQNEHLTKNEIHKWINPKISYYKYITGGIYFINEIPKSLSGKILRRQLKENLNIKSKL